MIGFAVVFGLLAVFIAQVWLNNQAKMQARHSAPEQPASTRPSTSSAVTWQRAARCRCCSLD